MTQSQNKFHSVTSILSWAKTSTILWLDDMPYVLKDGQYQYFIQVDKGFELAMISEKDLGAQK